MNQTTLMFAGLIAVAFGGLFYVFLYPILSGETRVEKRQAAIKQPTGARRAAGRNAVDTGQRRKQVADSLKELDERTKTKRISLEARITQAGLSIGKSTYFMASAVAAAAVAALIYYMSRNLFIAIPGLLIGGLGLPGWFLGFKRKRRVKKFCEEFPNAIDIIVRGIKSGLPLNDCIRIIAVEAAEPVKSEFRHIVEAQALGLTSAEAVERLVERVPVTETTFFSIVITIQSKSGGGLAEALGNLSKVLRERRKMRGKVGAMSMEAKASAAIIGALPFIVGLLVYVSSPQYMTLLFVTTTGKIAIGISGVWMLMGILVMKKMITFDI